MPYVQIELKKYSGIYAEIYIRGKDKKYQKIKLKSSSIKRYNAKFKLKCNNKKAVYYFKVRTIVKRVKKKYYSVYSDCLKVKVKGSWYDTNYKKNQKKFFVHAAGMDGYMKNNAGKVNKIKG